MRDGVVDLLPVAPPRRLSHVLMESRLIARAYESPLWRGCPLIVPMLGITASHERALVLAAAAPSPTDDVLDLACGPGNYTRAFAAQNPETTVVGLDLSGSMLAVAGRSARAAGLANTVFVRGTALDLPFDDARFGCVNCMAALHLFPDVPRVLAEVRRALAPGGRFTVGVFRRPRGALFAATSRLRRRLVGIYAFRPEELETLLAEAGFTNVRRLHEWAAWLVAVGTAG